MKENILLMPRSDVWNGQIYMGKRKISDCVGGGFGMLLPIVMGMIKIIWDWFVVMFAHSVNVLETMVLD